MHHSIINHRINAMILVRLRPAEQTSEEKRQSSRVSTNVKTKTEHKRISEAGVACFANVVTTFLLFGLRTRLMWSAAAAAKNKVQTSSIRHRLAAAHGIRIKAKCQFQPAPIRARHQNIIWERAFGTPGRPGFRFSFNEDEKRAATQEHTRFTFCCV